MTKLQIKLKSFDVKLIESAAIRIIDIAKSENAEVSGPIPLPTKRELFTILRSTHINKKSREQYEMRTHKRLIVLKKVTTKLVDKFKRIDLPSGIDLEVKIN